MRQGGNKKCRDYLNKQGLDLASCSIKERYESPVAHKYHQKLKKQIKAVAEKHPGLAPSIRNTPSSRSVASNDGSTGSKSNTPESRRAKALSPTSPTQDTASSNLSLQPTETPNREFISSPPRRISHLGANTNRRSPPRRTGSNGSFIARTSQIRASAPTIVYCGRSFLANNLDGYSNKGNDETLRISDEFDVTRKLEQLWYGDEDGTHLMSSNQSYASTSLSSSRSSYFGGASISNNNSGISSRDLRTLEKDTEVKEYLRQQLLKQWNRKQTTR